MKCVIIEISSNLTDSAIILRYHRRFSPSWDDAGSRAVYDSSSCPGPWAPAPPPLWRCRTQSNSSSLYARTPRCASYVWSRLGFRRRYCARSSARLTLSAMTSETTCYRRRRRNRVFTKTRKEINPFIFLSVTRTRQ